MFQGTGTALITPFDEDLNVEYNDLKKLVRFQLDNKVDFLVVLGTTGESPVIDEEERKKIIETVITEVNGKIPVVVGTGSNDTRKVVKLNKIAEDLKADGVLIVNPYYNKGTQSSLVEHYKYITERTPLPVIVYNVPGRTSMNILPDTILKIHQSCPNVVAVKEACADISQIAKLISMKPDSLVVLSGNDDQTFSLRRYDPVEFAQAVRISQDEHLLLAGPVPASPSPGRYRADLATFRPLPTIDRRS